MKYCFVDFETGCEADIEKVGGALYTEDPSLFMRCLAYAMNNQSCILADEVFVKAMNCPGLLEAAEDPDVMFVAHNAAFDRRVWNKLMFKLGFPKIPVERWICTSNLALNHGLPANLADACKAMNLKFQKQEGGKDLINLLCKPDEVTGLFLEYMDCPDKFMQFYHYCVSDVEAMRELFKHLSPLSHYERKVYMIDQRINDHGVRFDKPLAAKASVLIDKLQIENVDTLCDVTNYMVEKPTQRPSMKKWLEKVGFPLDNMQGHTLNKMLKLPNVPDKVKLAVEAYMEGGKSSLNKYIHILNMTNKDGYYRDVAVMNGSGTGRWASYGLQMLNLPRPRVDIQIAVTCLVKRSIQVFDYLYSPQTATALSSIIRALIIPDRGKIFGVVDYAQIENRVLAWSAGDTDKLQMFIDGEDLYCYAASKLYGRTITKEDKDERQVGKGSELGFQFGGGIGAGVNTANTYGVDLRPICASVLASGSYVEIKEAKKSYAKYLANCKTNKKRHWEIADKELGMTVDILKQRWRANNPKTVQYWADLQATIVKAIRTGKPYKCGYSTWFMHKRWLCCKLPSGRIMKYAHPKLKEKGKYSEITYMRVDPKTKRWGKAKLYGGKAAENETQAIANCILRDAMIRCEHKFPTYYHCHDELVTQFNKGSNYQEQLEEYKELVEQKEKWNETLPITVTGWFGDRYGKE